MKVRVIEGCEGLCLVFNDTRVAGPKPWGGGRTIAEWAVDDPRDDQIASLKKRAEEAEERAEELARCLLTRKTNDSL